MPNGPSRRRFLQLGATFASASLWPRLARSAQPDVVVVGAGAAGMAAARSLIEAGFDVTVVEADTRIGGRVHTDMSVFGIPYDIGAHWLHVGRLNPFVRYGRENGFDVYEAPGDEVLYVGDRPATDREYAAYEKALSAAYRAISRAGRKGRDVSAASVVPDGGEWSDLGPESLHAGFPRVGRARRLPSARRAPGAGPRAGVVCRRGVQPQSVGDGGRRPHLRHPSRKGRCQGTLRLTTTGAVKKAGPAFPDVQFLAMLWPSKRCNANELKGFSVRLRVFFCPSSLSEWCHCNDC